MSAASLRLGAWLLVAAALLVTPAKWLLLRGWLQQMTADGLAFQGWGIVLVLGTSIAAFLVLIAVMLFTLSRRIGLREQGLPGEFR